MRYPYFPKQELKFTHPKKKQEKKKRRTKKKRLAQQIGFFTTEMLRDRNEIEEKEKKDRTKENKMFFLCFSLFFLLILSFFFFHFSFFPFFLSLPLVGWGVSPLILLGLGGLFVLFGWVVPPSLPPLFAVLPSDFWDPFLVAVSLSLFGWTVSRSFLVAPLPPCWLGDLSSSFFAPPLF